MALHSGALFFMGPETAPDDSAMATSLTGMSRTLSPPFCDRV